jgi:hypothetical protein
MLNEYTQKFVDSVMKPATSSRPSSGKIYYDTVIIPYVKVISEKFRRIGNRLSFRTIFKTKHALQGRVMETGSVRDGQQKKQCV